MSTVLATRLYMYTVVLTNDNTVIKKVALRSAMREWLDETLCETVKICMYFCFFQIFLQSHHPPFSTSMNYDVRAIKAGNKLSGFVFISVQINDLCDVGSQMVNFPN